MIATRKNRRKVKAMYQLPTSMSGSTSALLSSSMKEFSKISEKQSKWYQSKEDINSEIIHTAAITGERTSKPAPVFNMFRMMVVLKCVTLQVRTAPGNQVTLDRWRWLWMLNFPSGSLWGSVVLKSSTSVVWSRNQAMLMSAGLKPETRHTGSPEPSSRVAEGSA